MLLDLETWIYGKISTAIGATARLDYFYPNDFTKLPVAAYNTAQRTSDQDYFDNVAEASDCTVEVDVYEKTGSDDYSLASTIETCMAGLLFNLDSSVVVPDPDAKLMHRNMTFTRSGVSASDLV